MINFVVKVQCRVRATVNTRRKKTVNVIAASEAQAAREGAFVCAREGFEVLGVLEVRPKSS